ncbi:hypothetical protein U6M47_13240, partial [Cutibacterium acnes]
KVVLDLPERDELRDLVSQFVREHPRASGSTDHDERASADVVEWETWFAGHHAYGELRASVRSTFRGAQFRVLNRSGVVVATLNDWDGALSLLDERAHADAAAALTAFGRPTPPPSAPESACREPRVVANPDFAQCGWLSRVVGL